jgi:hypothetical protein
MRCLGGCRRRLISGAIACWIATAVSCVQAGAQEDHPPEDDWGETQVTPAVSRFEFWAGAQASRQVWSLYTGTTVAPFADIQEDGLRLRVVGGYGAYRYAGPRAVGVSSEIVHFKGTVSFSDLLAGYQKQFGPVTVKAFAGLAVAQYRLEPDDPETTIRGPGVGAKGALETWWTITDRAWSSLDVSWSTLHDSYAARARLGWRFLPAVSAGLEAGAAGNRESDIARAGGFIRYEWTGGEISASGGLSSDRLWQGAGRASLTQSNAPFATVSWLARF